MGTVRIKTHWGVIEPLEDIPKSEWPDIVLKRGQWIKNALDYRLGKALDLLDEIERHEAWTATGMDRRNFLRFVCFIEPEDLPRIREGYRIMRQRGEEPTSRQEVLQFLAGPDGFEPLPLAMTHAEAGALGGRGKKADVINTGFTKGSTNVAYLIARLKRDAPAYAERLAAGEFRSARAAGIAAGIIVPPTKLEVALKAFRRLTSEDRQTFLQEIDHA